MVRPVGWPPYGSGRVVRTDGRQAQAHREESDQIVLVFCTSLVLPLAIDGIHDQSKRPRDTPSSAVSWVVFVTISQDTVEPVGACVRACVRACGCTCTQSRRMQPHHATTCATTTVATGKRNGTSTNQASSPAMPRMGLSTRVGMRARHAPYAVRAVHMYAYVSRSVQTEVPVHRDRGHRGPGVGAVETMGRVERRHLRHEGDEHQRVQCGSAQEYSTGRGCARHRAWFGVARDP